MPPCDADPCTAAGTAALRRSIEFAADVGARLVNLHLFTGQGVTAFAEALVPVLRQAAEANLALSVENTPEHAPEPFNRLFQKLGDLWDIRADAGRVGMCFDMGHANLGATTRNDYVGYLDALSPDVPVTHWHAHENWGDRDAHLALFTGPSASNDAGVRTLVRRLLRRGFRGSVILEQWPHPPELLKRARERLQTLLAEES